MQVTPTTGTAGAPRGFRRRRLTCGLFLLAACGASGAELEPMTVTATRSAVPLLATPGNVALIEQEAVETVAPRHASELFWRAPGTWVTLNSGQESLIAIRSPVLTGAGACGAFLVLEDGLPSRPAGFCNVNQLFELNVEQAEAVEVVRGPGSALYGSNALHGIINVLMPTPATGTDSLRLDAGPSGFLRGRLSGGRWDGDRGFRVTAQAMRDDGWRDQTGHEQAKLNASWLARDGAVERAAAVSGSMLRQETAGYITGLDAYRDPALARSNPNPEAFRDADSLRGWYAWRRVQGDQRLEIRPYFRASRMEFLQHFLPGQPLEDNGQVSAGVQLTASRRAGAGRLHYGLDLELAEGRLEQFQAGETTDLPPALAATRPQGLHYDYRVRAGSIAPWLHWERDLGADWTLGLGLRAERLAYDYDNRMLAGNTRDDGSECPGGCLYTRPADRSDAFFNLAPKLSLGWRPVPGQLAWVALRRGFRAPQATELYRLQSSQSVADLDSETLDSLELGWRGYRAGLAWELVGYLMEKNDYIFRDGDGFNVSDGRTRHTGIEMSLRWEIVPGLSLQTDQSFARHTWRFDRDVGRGEIIVSGNETDAAPRRFGSTRLAWDSGGRWGAELEWLNMGAYWLNAANTARYPGHDLLHLRLRRALSPQLGVAVRIHNLTDRAYAERADFAFGQYRYFPGRGRALFVELAWQGR